MDRRILIYGGSGSPIAAVTSMEAALAVSRLQGDRVLLARMLDGDYWVSAIIVNGSITSAFH